MTDVADTAEQPEQVEVTWDQLIEIFDAKCPSVPTVTAADFDARVLDRADRTRAVVVDFFAPNCGPCHASAEVFEAFARTGREVVKVDCLSEGGKPIADRFAVARYPTVVLFVGGKLRSIHHNDRTVEDFIAWVDHFAGPMQPAG